MNRFHYDIDGYYISFYLSHLFTTGNEDWCWIGPRNTPESVASQAHAITQLLSRDPAARLWLSSGGYGGMTLEEFLSQTQTEVTQ